MKCRAVSLVCLSGSYGAGGSRIGHQLAQRLGVPFLDRAIPAAVAEELEVPLEDVAAYDEQPGAGWLERLLSGFVALDVSQPTHIDAPAASAADFRRATEQVLRRQARSGDGVILGRGAMVVLRDQLHAMFVRLDGPAERRVEQAMRLEQVDRATAERRLRQLDRTHASYLRHYYGANVQDPSLYHVVLDSTRIELDVCVELLLAAVRSFERSGGRAAGALKPSADVRSSG